MIQLDRIYKRHGTRHGHDILAGVDLTLEPGEVALVSGATGVGKTTLVKLLYGAAFADAGAVRVFGRDVARLRRSSLGLLRQCMGIVPQAMMLMESRTVFDNVALALELRGIGRRAMRDRVAETLHAVGLMDDTESGAHVGRRRIAELSIGQRQLVRLARAIAGRPELVIADEPSCHLDNQGRVTLTALIAGVQARGGAALITTNDHKLLRAGADHCWRHLELADGALTVIADRKSERGLADDIAAYESIEISAESSAELSAELDRDAESAEVVPFPLAARAGGMQ